jgi:hypothetical protein
VKGERQYQGGVAATALPDGGYSAALHQLRRYANGRLGNVWCGHGEAGRCRSDGAGIGFGMGRLQICRPSRGWGQDEARQICQPCGLWGGRGRWCCGGSLA